MTRAETEAHDREVATRCVGIMIVEDVTVEVEGDAIERMINRVMGAMQIARAVDQFVVERLQLVESAIADIQERAVFKFER